MRKSWILLVGTVAAILAACAAQPPARPAISTVPPLEQGVGRVIIGTGMQNRGDMQQLALSSVRQVGPVYLNGKYVGNTGQNEYFVIDVAPGEYEASCSPQEPVRNIIEKMSFKVVSGETKHLVCEMGRPKMDEAEKYQSRTYLEERGIDLSTERAVVYTKLP